MKTIRNYVYAAILAATAFNFAPAAASAEEVRGKFTLTHEVHLGNAKLAAGDYEFSYNPDSGSRMLSLTKLSGTPAGYMVLVPDTEDGKSTDASRMVLETTADGSYVSAMQLPELGVTLHFTVPRSTERQIAKAGITATAAGQ